MSVFLAISGAVIISYLLSVNQPELWVGAEDIFNFWYQVSIGYLVGFIFYIMQVYLPLINRRDVLMPQMKLNITEYICRYDTMIHMITETHGIELNKENYKEIDPKMEKLKVLNFNLASGFISLETRKSVPISSEIHTAIMNGKTISERIFMRYQNDLSPRVVSKIVAIEDGEFHTLMIKILQRNINSLDFGTKSENPLYSMYVKLRELEELIADECSSVSVED